MVDFNNEATIATPAIDIERVTILQKRENYLEAYEKFLTDKGQNIQPRTAYISARLGSLYAQLVPLIEERLSPEELKVLTNLLESKLPNMIHEGFQTINRILRDINLTKIDSKTKLGGNLKDHNKVRGWKS